MANETLMRQFKDNSCLVAPKRERLLRQGSADILAKMLFLHLARCVAFMATPVVASRRPGPQDVERTEYRRPRTLP
ncbi:hypothetical protein DPMN_150658 [Dreissena polymorpha]|uniref:Uncharacterized protein n=1 Tax=Dreissena polymorpha TaxID=45954 RepID=A0A9D4FGW4_DREPO|nr:hypothetical protein DPMN_150658 [Dreissena polymorpha]